MRRRVAFILRHMLAMLATHTHTQQRIGHKKGKLTEKIKEKKGKKTRIRS